MSATTWPEWEQVAPGRWTVVWNGYALELVRTYKFYKTSHVRYRALAVSIRVEGSIVEIHKIHRTLNYKNKIPSFVVMQYAVEQWLAESVAKRLTGTPTDWSTAALDIEEWSGRI